MAMLTLQKCKIYFYIIFKEFFHEFQDTVTYRIVAQEFDYFYIAPETGGIYLRRSIVLSNTINNRYVVRKWALVYMYISIYIFR